MMLDHLQNTSGIPRGPITVAARRGPTMFAKRIIDLVGASALLVLTAPLLLIVAVSIRLTSPGPVVFCQERVGLCGRTFVLFKFRSMFDGVTDATHRAQNLAELAGEGEIDGRVSYKDADDPRITPVGRILRRFSIDELPQLINVLKGDMSLVGPRPSLVWEVAEFPLHIDRRFSVRPGLTGLWQVSGRNNWSLREMLEIDCDYADSLTVLGDIGILLRTVPAAVRGDGAA
ncbi:MAG: sugar transferase [Acidimicrobiales bacterium]